MTAREIALRHGACPHPACTNARRTTFHFDGRCPERTPSAEDVRDLLESASGRPWAIAEPCSQEMPDPTFGADT